MRTWLETLSNCLVVNFGMSGYIYFSTCVGEQLMAVASKRVTHVFSHASIGVWLVSRGLLAPLLSTMCLFNWCQHVCHCVYSIAAVEELLSHGLECYSWYRLLLRKWQAWLSAMNLLFSLTNLKLHYSSFLCVGCLFFFSMWRILSKYFVQLRDFFWYAEIF